MQTWILIIIAVTLLLTLGVLFSNGLAKFFKGEFPFANDPNGLIGSLFVRCRHRTYYLHLPPGASPTNIPLVIAFHGGYGNGYRFARLTGLNAVADREGFAVVYPNARTRWNDGRTSSTMKTDDLIFVRTLIDRLTRTRRVDRRRIFAAGASSGGMFVLRLACQLPDRIAGFATVSAAMPVLLSTRCRPSRQISLLMINGTADQLVPWGGGDVRAGRSWGAGGKVLSVPDTLAFWRKCHDGWSDGDVESLPDRTGGACYEIKVLTYICRQGGARLKLVEIEGGGHNWPGARTVYRPLRAQLTGRTTHAIKATELIWDFFRDCPPLPGRTRLGS